MSPHPWTESQVKRIANNARALFGDVWLHVAQDLRQAIADRAILDAVCERADGGTVAPATSDEISALRSDVYRQCGID